MRHHIPAITAVVAALTIGLCVFARDNNRWDEEAQRRKAEYIYGEAQRQYAIDSTGAQYQLYQRAYLIDSTNPAYFSDIAYFYLTWTQRDESLIHQAKNLLAKKFEADPTDVSNTYNYARLEGQLGNVQRQLEIMHVLDSLNPSRHEIALSYIDMMISSGDSTMPPKALKRIDALEVATGKSIESTQRKVSIYAYLNDSISALNEMHNAIASSPLNPDYYMLTGRVFEIFSNKDSSLYYYKKACELEPGNGNASVVLAEFYKKTGDNEGYSREINRALLETDLDVQSKHDMLLDYTRNFINDSTYIQHVNSTFNKVIEKNPQETMIRDLYAEALSAQDKFAAAAEQMDFVVDLQPEESSNWAKCGVYHLNADNYVKARDILNRGLKYHNTDPFLHQLLASAYNSPDDGDTAKAIDELKIAYELTDSTDYENRAQRLTYIGDLFSNDEQKDSAIIYYRKALEISPNDILTNNNYAYLISEISNDSTLLAEAEAMSFKTITAEPENPTYLDTYAWILYKQQNYKKAKEYIDRALSLTEESGEEFTVDYYIHAGDIYFWNQLPEKALEFWEKALQLDPENELLARKVKHKTYFHE